MFTDLPSVRVELAERITDAVPADWRIVPNISEAIKALVPVVYIEFTEFSGAILGVPLSAFQVATAGDIVVASAETDTAKAEDAVDAHVLPLVQALQAMPDLYWDTAKKERLTGGQIAWRVSFTCITNLPEAPSTEG